MGELFNNLGIDWKLLFAQTVNFLLVFWLLKRFVFKKLLRFLEERRQGIERGVELTENAQKEMERVKEKGRLQLESARKEADDIFAKARDAARTQEKEILFAAKESAEKSLLKAKEDAEKEKEEKLKSAKEEILKRAMLVAEKVLARTIGEKDEKKMAEELLNYSEKNYGKES